MAGRLGLTIRGVQDTAPSTDEPIAVIKTAFEVGAGGYSSSNLLGQSLSFPVEDPRCLGHVEFCVLREPHCPPSSSASSPPVSSELRVSYFARIPIDTSTGQETAQLIRAYDPSGAYAPIDLHILTQWTPADDQQHPQQGHHDGGLVLNGDGDGVVDGALQEQQQEEEGAGGACGLDGPSLHEELHQSGVEETMGASVGVAGQEEVAAAASRVDVDEVDEGGLAAASRRLPQPGFISGVALRHSPSAAADDTVEASEVHTNPAPSPPDASHDADPLSTEQATEKEDEERVVTKGRGERTEGRGGMMISSRSRPIAKRGGPVRGALRGQLPRKKEGGEDAEGDAPSRPGTTVRPPSRQTVGPEKEREKERERGKPSSPHALPKRPLTIQTSSPGRGGRLSSRSTGPKTSPKTPTEIAAGKGGLGLALGLGGTDTGWVDRRVPPTRGAQAKKAEDRHASAMLNGVSQAIPHQHTSTIPRPLGDTATPLSPDPMCEEYRVPPELAKAIEGPLDRYQYGEAEVYLAADVDARVEAYTKLVASKSDREASLLRIIEKLRNRKRELKARAEESEEKCRTLQRSINIKERENQEFVDSVDGLVADYDTDKVTSHARIVDLERTVERIARTKEAAEADVKRSIQAYKEAQEKYEQADQKFRHAETARLHAETRAQYFMDQVVLMAKKSQGEQEEIALKEWTKVRSDWEKTVFDLRKTNHELAVQHYEDLQAKAALQTDVTELRKELFSLQSELEQHKALLARRLTTPQPPPTPLLPAPMPYPPSHAPDTHTQTDTEEMVQRLRAAVQEKNALRMELDVLKEQRRFSLIDGISDGNSPTRHGTATAAAAAAAAASGALSDTVLSPRDGVGLGVTDTGGEGVGEAQPMPPRVGNGRGPALPTLMEEKDEEEMVADKSPAAPSVPPEQIALHSHPPPPPAPKTEDAPPPSLASLTQPQPQAQLQQQRPREKETILKREDDQGAALPTPVDSRNEGMQEAGEEEDEGDGEESPEGGGQEDGGQADIISHQPPPGPPPSLAPPAAAAVVMKEVHPSSMGGRQETAETASSAGGGEAATVAVGRVKEETEGLGAASASATGAMASVQPLQRIRGMICSSTEKLRRVRGAAEDPELEGQIKRILAKDIFDSTVRRIGPGLFQFGEFTCKVRFVAGSRTQLEACLVHDAPALTTTTTAGPLTQRDGSPREGPYSDFEVFVKFLNSERSRGMTDRSHHHPYHHHKSASSSDLPTAPHPVAIAAMKSLAKAAAVARQGHQGALTVDDTHHHHHHQQQQVHVVPPPASVTSMAEERRIRFEPPGVVESSPSVCLVQPEGDMDTGSPGRIPGADPQRVERRPVAQHKGDGRGGGGGGAAPFTTRAVVQTTTDFSAAQQQMGGGSGPYGPAAVKYVFPSVRYTLSPYSRPQPHPHPHSGVLPGYQLARGPGMPPQAKKGQATRPPMAKSAGRGAMEGAGGGGAVRVGGRQMQNNPPSPYQAPIRPVQHMGVPGPAMKPFAFQPVPSAVYPLSKSAENTPRITKSPYGQGIGVRPIPPIPPPHWLHPRPVGRHLSGPSVPVHGQSQGQAAYCHAHTPEAVRRFPHGDVVVLPRSHSYLPTTSTAQQNDSFTDGRGTMHLRRPVPLYPYPPAPAPVQLPSRAAMWEQHFASAFRALPNNMQHQHQQQQRWM
ncbi:unnamed protein product [Vitrella brassicaformis CCMP3155]|uniref:Uncharacterized protein n=6 Tax=Vitrella brassicaformis TaxID=1169539 RepID=A0A0G4EH48_VITBC|nr:unnamed protein product [Vitrella brassicaformis CCMP3155]|eukprot:CEL94973.1 unnamed protein product [Vitrella brassicaformis CCMP3155]